MPVYCRVALRLPALRSVRPAFNLFTMMTDTTGASDLKIPGGAAAYRGYSKMRFGSPAKRSASRGRQTTASMSHQTNLCGNDTPATGKPNPGLLLTADTFAAFTGELGTAYRIILSIGCDHRMA